MTIRYIVQGRVQGVGFRHFTVQTARAFGVCGSVRNLDDGSVEIVACADTEALQAFIEQIGIGPRYARVDRVTGTEIPREFFSDFRVVA